MANIGTFTGSLTKELKGSIHTLALNVENVRITPELNSAEDAPSHRIMVGKVMIGAAWSKVAKNGTVYLSVKFEEPSIPTFYASLFVSRDTDEEFDLVWNAPLKAAA